MSALPRAAVPIPFLLFALSGGCESLSDPDPTYWIAIDAPSTTLAAPGGTVQLTATMGDETNRVVEGAAMTWSSTRPGVATVDANGLVTGLSTGQTVIRASSGSAVGSIALDVVQVGSCDLAGELSVPDTVFGAMQEQPCTDAPPWCSQVWVLGPGRPVDATITLASVSPGWPYILDGRGQSLELDYDRGIGYRRVSLSLLEDDAPYFVCVGGFAGYTDAYALSVIEGPAPVQPCPAAAALPYPGVVQGSATSGDCEYAGYRIDTHSLTLTEPSVPMLAVRGDPDRPVLELRDSAGVALPAGGFSAGEGQWLEASEPLPAGTYQVSVGLAEEEVGGQYSLESRAGPALVACETGGPLAPGGTATGTIDLDDCPLAAVPHAGPADGYDMVVADTTAFEFTMTSDAFFPTVTISDSAGTVVAFSREASFADTREVALPPGRYRAWIKPLYAYQRGAYDFSVDPAGRMPPCADTGALSAVDTVIASLTTADCQVQHDRFADVWSFQLDDPGSITAKLVTDLPGYLVLTDSAGSIIASDDDAERQGWIPRVTVALEPGSYRLWAMSFWPRETGDYSLSLGPGE